MKRQEILCILWELFYRVISGLWQRYETSTQVLQLKEDNSFPLTFVYCCICFCTFSSLHLLTTKKRSLLNKAGFKNYLNLKAHLLEFPLAHSKRLAELLGVGVGVLDAPLQLGNEVKEDLAYFLHVGAFHDDCDRFTFPHFHFFLENLMVVI